MATFSCAAVPSCTKQFGLAWPLASFLVFTTAINKLFNRGVCPQDESYIVTSTGTSTGGHQASLATCLLPAVVPVGAIAQRAAQQAVEPSVQPLKVKLSACTLLTQQCWVAATQAECQDWWVNQLTAAPNVQTIWLLWC
jgi:hypothetical protein